MIVLIELFKNKLAHSECALRNLICLKPSSPIRNPRVGLYSVLFPPPPTPTHLPHFTVKSLY